MCLHSLEYTLQNVLTVDILEPKHVPTKGAKMENWEQE